MTSCSRLLAVAVLLASACSSASRQRPAAPGGAPSSADGRERLACSFFWRQSDAHPHTATKHVELAAGRTAFSLEDFDVALTVERSEAGGRALAVEAIAGAATIRSSYDFGSAPVPQHLPPGGHGFTGLRYLTVPESGSEMQFFCGAYDETVDVRDEMASQSLPGLNTQADAVNCEFTASDNSGAELARETFALESGGSWDAVDLGGFAVSVRHIQPGPESGAIVVEAGEPRDGEQSPLVHVLYQLSEPGLPANAMDGESFTGIQSVATDDRTLEYRCWSA